MERTRELAPSGPYSRRVTRLCLKTPSSAREETVFRLAKTVKQAILVISSMQPDAVRRETSRSKPDRVFRQSLSHVSSGTVWSFTLEPIFVEAISNIASSPYYFRVGLVANVNESDLVILTVTATRRGLVLVLKPVRADNLRVP